MKIDRLIGILSELLQKDMVTAPELARRFEVSRRTIGRDIEDLCRAGIPVSTRQGIGGGISIMEGYRVDRTLLTSRDMQMILAGLRSLDSVSGNHYYSRLMEKLQPGSSDFMNGRDSVLIDLSSWYRDALAPKIEAVQTAIDGKHPLDFYYYGPKGESRRCIEPCYLVFKWSSWYVWGWCRAREDFRLFKLNRMEQLSVSAEHFESREVPLPNLGDERVFPGGIPVKALFEPEMKWRLVEEYGPGCFEEQPDGRLLFHGEYTNRENLFYWLLAFGDKVRLLEPEDMQPELLKTAEAMAAIYRETGESC
mgnify:CR=1 FL=1